ncbi:DNA topoisomerase IB [Pinibacter soli]|uniref:DNA topoisomerase n=1 Tax=Pinibacter soli TaxID=3044211 RepID=A0ABT6RDP7_9BACT|nr:DNA topoisomerase IB [Pinibacter soli]MDI3320704.1 DNA topoisomerase IB [Pinibacter soli]
MEALKLSHPQFLRIAADYKESAKVAHLVYVSVSDPGIVRVKKGKGFSYYLEDKLVKSKDELLRFKKLVIPPAWKNVWICTLPEGHIQAAGLDARGRKQYRYHPLWNVLRNETKFHRMLEFGKMIPALRAKIEQDIVSKELNADKVIATVISLMERTYIRIGNEGYEKLYGSYGLTTLKDKHVSVKGDKISFSFKGKKGVYHNVSLTNKRLAKIVEACRDIPGKELFQFYDSENNRKSIDSGAVNNYIKEATGADFTAKDFRTWAGTLNALRAFKSMGEAATSTEGKKNVVAVLDEVSQKLGNTRAVCKKYYVHPGLIKMYEENNLKKYITALDKIEEPDNKTDLTGEEKVLMKVLAETI